MKAKRLIEILQSIVEEKGDVDVHVPENRGYTPVAKEVRVLENSESVHIVDSGSSMWTASIHRVYRERPVLIEVESQYETIRPDR